MRTYFLKIFDISKFKKLGFLELLLLGVITGAFPLIHYYSFNFSSINSLAQFLYFILLFILVPTLFYSALFFLTKRFNFSSEVNQKLVTYINCIFFIIFGMLSLFRMNSLRFFAIIIVAFPISYIIHRHIQKIFFFQLIFVLLALGSFLPKLYGKLSQDNSWQELPDNIAEVKFKRHPNVYIL